MTRLLFRFPGVPVLVEVPTKSGEYEIAVRSCPYCRKQWPLTAVGALGLSPDPKAGEWPRGEWVYGCYSGECRSGVTVEYVGEKE